MKPKNRNYVSYLEPQYLEQQAAVRRVCSELKLTCYKPDYHALGNDCNTLLIYHNADHDYNMELDRARIYNPEYRPYIVALQNTDKYGRFSLNFMNNGLVDLRGIDKMKPIRYFLRTIINKEV